MVVSKLKRSPVLLASWFLLRHVSQLTTVRSSQRHHLRRMRAFFLVHGIYSQFIGSNAADHINQEEEPPSSLQELLFPPQLTALSVVTCLVGKLSLFSTSINARASCVLLWVIQLAMPGLLWTAFAETEDPIAESDPCALAAVVLAVALGGRTNITAAGVILLMLTGGEALEDYALTRAGDGLRRLIQSFRLDGTARQITNNTTQTATTKKKTPTSLKRKTMSAPTSVADAVSLPLPTIPSIQHVSVQQLTPGDVIQLAEGETCPTDGVVENPQFRSTSSSSPPLTLSPSPSTPPAPAFCVMCDESAITGESGAVPKYTGHPIHSGTVVCRGKCNVRVVRTVNQSMGGLIRSELSEALSDRRKTPMERSCANFARALTPIAFSVAALSYWWHSKRTRRTAGLTARAIAIQNWEIILSVLMAATPCPLSIGVPVAFLSARSSVTNAGITLKSGGALETLARVTCVVLDKTGTLTTGKMKLCNTHFEQMRSTEDSNVVTKDSNDVAKDSSQVTKVTSNSTVVHAAIECIAAVEVHSGSRHAVATADYFNTQENNTTTTTTAATTSTNRTRQVECSTSHPGRGVSGVMVSTTDLCRAFGTVGVSLGHPVHVIAGSKKYVNEQLVALTNSNGNSNHHPSFSSSTTETARFEVCCAFVTKGNAILWGTLSFTDPLRSYAIPFVSRLKKEYRVVLTSGDRSPALKQVACQLQLNPSEWHHCLPDDKASLIKQLKQDGETVLMVGDGLNDAAALAVADVAIAVGTNDLVASVSDVVMNSRQHELEKVLGLLKTSKKVLHVARRGVAGGMAMSTVQMFCAATGTVPPVVNAVLQEVVDVCTVLHAILSPSTFVYDKE